MKTKKMLILFIVLFAVMLVFIPKAYAGGGGGFAWDVAIGETGEFYGDVAINAYDGKIGQGHNLEYSNKIFFESDDFNEYITEVNKYLPEGILLKANENKTYDVYMNNVNCDKFISFNSRWSGKLYFSGKNNLNCLSLMPTKEANKEVIIIGNGTNETNIHVLDICGKATFKNCNINFSIPETWGLGLHIESEEQIILEGRVKIEIESNVPIYAGDRSYNRDILKNFIGAKYNTEYEKVNDYGEIWNYSSPEAIIIKNYDDAKLLEQSVEKIKSGEALIFRFDKEIDKFEELYINENLLTRDVDYTIESGSTIVKLSEEYTKKLAAGNYEVKAMFKDGEGTATFEVLGKAEETEEKVLEETKEIEETKDNRTLDKTPKTGNENNNNNNFYILLSVFTTITLGIVLKRKIK